MCVSSVLMHSEHSEPRQNKHSTTRLWIVVPVVQLYHARIRADDPASVRLHGAVVKKIAQKHSPQRLFFPGQRTAPASLAWRGTAWIGYPG